MKLGADVAMCAVIGTPDAKFGEIVTAIVVPAPGKRVVAEQIVSHCRGLIAGFKVPRHITFGPLPKTATGKIQKFELRARVRGG
jgi:fatty-acyl-CoA synthase